MPLTLIAGWYGMNFKYMPELQYKWAYPAVIVLSIGIVIGSIILFKKKNGSDKEDTLTLPLICLPQASKVH